MLLLGRKFIEYELFYFYLERFDFQRFFFIDQLKGWGEFLFVGEFYDKYLKKDRFLVFLIYMDLENSVFLVIFMVLLLEIESDCEIGQKFYESQLSGVVNNC